GAGRRVITTEGLGQRQEHDRDEGDGQEEQRPFAGGATGGSQCHGVSPCGDARALPRVVRDAVPSTRAGRSIVTVRPTLSSRTARRGEKAAYRLPKAG